MLGNSGPNNSNAASAEDLEALRNTCRVLLAFAKASAQRLEAMRLLLERHGVFSEAEFAEAFFLAQERWTREYKDEVAKALQDELTAKQFALLEKLEGEPQ